MVAGDELVVPRVLHTRGAANGGLARLLAPEPIEVAGNLPEAVVEAKADILVTSRLSSFDLVPVCVPIDFDHEAVDHVLAAVGTGPHSRFAADVAVQLGAELGVKVELVAAALDSEADDAERRLVRLAEDRPGTLWRVAATSDPVAMLEEAPDGTLLVLGAPGGNWFQRQMFGAGARLRAKTPGGSVVVRNAPRRVFHVVREPTLWLSPHMNAADGPPLMVDEMAPVVDGGVLVGVVSRARLAADPSGMIGDHVIPAPTVQLIDSVDALADVAAFFGDSPIPIVDDDGRLVGEALRS
jgi:hypothetical protein